MTKFPTTIWTTPDPDGVHCGDCDKQIPLHPDIANWICRPFGGSLRVVFPNHNCVAFIRCQACFDAEQKWKESQEEEAKAAIAHDKLWDRRFEYSVSIKPEETQTKDKP
jgi:hypothetical protein